MTFLSSILNFPIVVYLVSFFKEFMVSVLRVGPVPEHIAFVMDGNRRYAKEQGLPLKEGHNSGAETLVEVLDLSYKAGIKTCTIYAFSIENFNRSKEEVDTLFGLLRTRLQMLSRYEESVFLKNIKIKIVGNKTMIPPEILVDLEQIEKDTSHFTEKVLNVCFPYTSRDDILHSMTTVVEKVKDGKMQTFEVNEETLDRNMYFGDDSHKVDILVRTSGHTRLSDFLIWQCNDESTIEFVNVLWPDFGAHHLLWILYKWSYYKTLMLNDAQIVKPVGDQGPVAPIARRPPFASVVEA